MWTEAEQRNPRRILYHQSVPIFSRNKAPIHLGILGAYIWNLFGRESSGLKVAAGSLARLLKMELQKRGPQFNT